MSNELPPGRELDALVSEKVFGEKFVFPRPYSRSIGDAWRIVEHYVEAGYHPDIRCTFDFDARPTGWMFKIAADCTARAATAPHAICLAALDAAARGNHGS